MYEYIIAWIHVLCTFCYCLLLLRQISLSIQILNYPNFTLAKNSNNKKKDKKTVPKTVMKIRQNW